MIRARIVLLLFFTVAVTSCAANLTFIDRTTGQEYEGKTGGTVSGDGNVTALIENEQYAGTWIYEQNGGGYSLGTAYASNGSQSSYATGTAIGVSAQGNGLINMKASSGHFMRCVFSFNAMSNHGLGECQRNDGRLYDLRAKR